MLIDALQNDFFWGAIIKKEQILNLPFKIYVILKMLIKWFSARNDIV